MKHSHLLTGFGLALLFVFMTACSSGGADDTAATSSPTPAGPSGEQAAATAVPSLPPGESFPAAPVAGAACPVALTLCEFAVQLQSALEAGDSAAFLALAHSVTATCTGEIGPGHPSPDLCEGAAPGEIRAGYWDLQGGAGHVVTDAELRLTLDQWFASISRAGSGSDAYGPGQLQIGSISCTRQPDQAIGTCIGNSIQIHFTFINPPDATGTGAPGERMSFHVSASVVEGQIRANGLGTVVPPNRVLQASLINIQGGQANPLLVEIYPWTHSADALGAP